MSPDTKYRHITVQFTYEQYASLLRCAQAAYGVATMANVVEDERADHDAEAA